MSHYIFIMLTLGIQTIRMCYLYKLIVFFVVIQLSIYTRLIKLLESLKFCGPYTHVCSFFFKQQVLCNVNEESCWRIYLQLIGFKKLIINNCICFDIMYYSYLFISDFASVFSFFHYHARLKNISNASVFLSITVLTT